MSDIGTGQTKQGVPGGIITGIIVAGLAGLFYGAVGALIPLVIAKVLIIVLALMCAYLVFESQSGAFILTLIGGVIGSAAAVAGLWFGWTWQEFGLQTAMELAKAGPEAAYKQISIWSEYFTYSLSRRSTTTDGGQGMTLFIWIGETVLFALAPLLGAMASRRQKSLFAEQVERANT